MIPAPERSEVVAWNELGVRLADERDQILGRLRELVGQLDAIRATVDARNRGLPSPARAGVPGEQIRRLTPMPPGFEDLARAIGVAIDPQQGGGNR